MKNTRALSRSIFTLLAFAPLAANATSKTINASGTETSTNPAVAWATPTLWSPVGKPGGTDNAIIGGAGAVNIRGESFASTGNSTEIEDLKFSGTGNTTLANDSTSTDMTLVLNGARGTGVPLISTTTNFVFTIQSPGYVPGGSTPHALTLQLKNSGSIDVAGTGSLLINSAITQTGGARSLTKTGTGRLTLGGANTFSGGMTLTTGVLEAASAGALGTGATVVNGGTLDISVIAASLTASSITANAGSLVSLKSGSTLTNAMTLHGATLTTRGGDLAIFGGAINVNADSAVSLTDYLIPANSQNITISGLLSGANAFAISGNAVGGKTLILTNTANNFSGAFRVGAGQTLRSAPAASGSTLGTAPIELTGASLQIADNGAGSGGTLAYGNNVSVQSGATFQVDRANANTGNTVQFGSLTTGAGTLNFSGANSYAVRFAGTTTLTGAATFNTATANATLNGAVSGAFDLIKTGSGTLTMNAANTYSGQTIVNAGTLVVNGSVANTTRLQFTTNTTLDVSGVAGGFVLGGSQTLAGPATVIGAVTASSGARIEGGDFGNLGTLTIPSLTLGTAAGHTASLQLAPGLIALPLNVTTANGFSANGGVNTVTLDLSGPAPTVGQHVLVDYNGTLGGAGFSAFKLGTLPPRTVATLVDNAANSSIDVNVTGVDFPVWRGSVSSEWSTATLANPKNWILNSNNATVTDFISNDVVLFNDSAANPNLDISVADVSAGSVTFDNSNLNYTLGGSNAIAGVTGLVKMGTGTTTISNTNKFTGDVTLKGGTISVANVTNAGVEGPIGAGNTIAFDGGTLEITGGPGGTTRTITLAAGGGTIKSDSQFTVSTVISGPGMLTKSGTGLLVIPATNTYSGGTNITGGIIRLGSTNRALGSGFAVTISDGGTLDLNAMGGNASTRRYDLIISGQGVAGQAAIWNSSATGVVNDAIYRSVTLAGDASIGGIGRYDLNGGGVDGPNVAFNGGTYTLTKVGPSECWWSPNAGATVGSIVINGGIFGVQSSMNLGDKTFPIIINAGGTLYTYANQTNDKAIAINGGRFGANFQTGTWTGPVMLTGAGVSNIIAPLGGTQVTLQGQVSGNGFEKLDPGTLELRNATNNWTGDTRVTTGTIRVASGGALSPATTLDMNGGTVDLNGSAQIVAGLRGGAGTIQGGGSLKVNQTAATTYAGGITSALTLNKDGAGSLTLTGAQTYPQLVVTAGTLNLNSTLANATITDTGGTLNINASATNSTVNANGSSSHGTHFTVSQTIAALNIGPSGYADIGPAAPEFVPEAFFGGDFGNAGEELAGASSTQAVPEPGAFAMLLLGLSGIIAQRRRS